MRRRDQRGVTMVELMVAMVLMAVALLALAASIPYALYGVVASGFQTTATLLAQEAIERAKAADYGSIGPELRRIVGDPAHRLQRHLAPGDGIRRIRSLRGGPAGHADCTTTTITAVVEFSGSVPNPIYRTTVVTIRSN